MNNSIVEVINTLKQRPAMYLSRNYISSLKSYLTGWSLRDPSSIIDGHVMDDFQDWVRSKYNITTTQSWDSIILFFSQDEQDALQRFFSHFEEFISKKQKR